MFKPQFSISNNLLTYISRIEAAKSVIESAALVPAWEAKFRDDAMARMVHYGTKVEGNDLTEDQVSQVMKMKNVRIAKEMSQETGMVARERDIQEVINYRDVIKWIDNWEHYVADSSKFTPEILETLHNISMRRILDDDAVGSYRNKQVVVTSATDNSIVFRPPVFVEIPYLIDEFFAWLNDRDEQARVHPILRAAITHYQLVYIHPFIEGNGRTARAMATLVMYAADYDFKRFFSIEQYFDQDVEAYYQALLSVQQSTAADMTYWLEYFCYGLALEIEKVREQVQKLSKDLKMKKELGKQVALSERQIILLELLQKQEEISSSDAQHVLPNVSVDTILRDIKDLIDKGVVKKHGVTKGVTYSLTE